MIVKVMQVGHFENLTLLYPSGAISLDRAPGLASANLGTVQKYFVMKIFFQTNQVVQGVVP